MKPVFNSSLPGAIRASGYFAITICIGCSIAMAGWFLHSLGGGQRGIVMLAIAAAILVGGLVVGRYAGYLMADNKNGLAGLCLFTFCCVSAFSVSTSAISFQNVSNQRISEQTTASEGHRHVQTGIAQNRATISSLQQTIDGLDPVRWQGRRAQLAEQISGLNQQNMSLLRMSERNISRGAGSSVSSAFNQFGELVGLSGDSVRILSALLIAFLLDLIPLTISVCMGFYQRQEQTGKKSQAVKLRAVA